MRTMDAGAARATRRRVLGTGAAAAISVAASTATVVTAAQEATPAATGEATMPDWRFLVLTYADPYEKEMLQPQEPVEGVRYLGAEVEIRNGSDRPLAVSLGQLRLRTTDATEYLTGGFVGSDPRIYDVNMLPGERVRGWIWFGVPEDATIAELAYIPVAPQLRVAVGASDGS